MWVCQVELKASSWNSAVSTVSVPSSVQWPVSDRHFTKSMVGSGHEEVDQERLLRGDELGHPKADGRVLQPKDQRVPVAIFTVSGRFLNDIS